MRIVNPDQEEYSGLVQLYKDDGNKKKIQKIIHAIYCLLLSWSFVNWPHH
jgi:hypothetical protein